MVMDLCKFRTSIGGNIIQLKEKRRKNKMRESYIPKEKVYYYAVCKTEQSTILYIGE